MSKADEQEKNFFEKLGEILNAPLPGADKKTVKKTSGDDDSVLDRIREILTQPLPGTNPPVPSKKDEEAIIKNEDFTEKWWDRDWEIFKAHQNKDRQALNRKQRKDQESFARYQEQERTTFDNYQRREFEMYQQHQQWKMNVWQERMARGDSAEPPPWGTSVKAVPSPFSDAPPWMK